MFLFANLKKSVKDKLSKPWTRILYTWIKSPCNLWAQLNWSEIEEPQPSIIRNTLKANLTVKWIDTSTNPIHHLSSSLSYILYSPKFEVALYEVSPDIWGDHIH